VKIDLIQYIISRVPLSFFTLASEHLEAAYFSAHQYAQTFEEAERARILGQLRHYRQNEAIRMAAMEAGLTATAPHTYPKGERYTLIAAENIIFSRVNVPFNNHLPRPSKYRRLIATINQRLEPTNEVLFGPEPIRPPSNGLGCLIVTVNPPRFEPQSTPFNLIVGVPYTSLKGWHLFEPISSILAEYHPTQEIEVPDMAWAKLKKQLGEAED